MQIVLFCFATGICTLSFLVKIFSQIRFLFFKNIVYFAKIEFPSFLLFPKINNFGNFSPNVLRLVSAI